MGAWIRRKEWSWIEKASWNGTAWQAEGDECLRMDFEGMKKSPPCLGNGNG